MHRLALPPVAAVAALAPRVGHDAPDIMRHPLPPSPAVAAHVQRVRRGEARSIALTPLAAAAPQIRRDAPDVMRHILLPPSPAVAAHVGRVRSSKARIVRRLALPLAAAAQRIRRDVPNVMRHPLPRPAAVAAHARGVPRSKARIVRRLALSRLAVVAAVLAFLALAPRTAAAHGMRSAYIEITETAPGRARVAIRGNVPVTGIALTAEAPCSVAISPDTGTELVCPDRLADAAVTVTGMGPIVSEAVLFVSFVDGTSTTACVTPGAPSWRIPGADTDGLTVAGRYLRLGIEHIATGTDHLLFLLALVLCLRTLRAVMLAETAFTLSHTLSFSASSLGWVHVSATAAEACIAVSLVLVALDVGRAARDAPAGAARDARDRKTAGLAFAFGLVHGLGFAGGLAEIGLPATAVPVALAGFAGGVEIGQVAFLAIAVALLGLAGRIPRLSRAAIQIGAYAVGGIGWFWLLERLAALGGNTSPS
jgi:hypothetical protein